jgi:hypothetical protein
MAHRCRAGIRPLADQVRRARCILRGQVAAELDAAVGQDSNMRDHRMSRKESQIEQQLIDKLVDELKYTRREDIHDKAAGAEFPRQVPGLNQVRLTDAEFARLRDDIIGADVFQAARTLREYGYLQREIALKALGLSPRRAMEQIVDYKNDPGNGYNAARGLVHKLGQGLGLASNAPVF